MIRIHVGYPGWSCVRAGATFWEQGFKDDLRPTLPMFLSLPSRLCGVLSLY